MDRARLRATIPYLLWLVLAVWLFVAAGGIEYAARTGQIGPDLWPRLALGLMAAASLFEIVRILFLGRRGEAHGIGDAITGEPEEEDAGRSLPLLLGGVVLTLAYGVVIPMIGFPVATFLYLAAFMYLGRYRNHLVIWLSSAVGALTVSVLFLNVVYVSLPRGLPPFDGVTDAIIGLF